jgi:hypothetical protein
MNDTKFLLLGREEFLVDGTSSKDSLFRAFLQLCMLTRG